MEDRHLSLSEVAGSMGVSERTVRRWIKAGRLKAYKPGRDYRIPDAALREFVEESEVFPKAPHRSSLELKLFNGSNDERRLPTVADLLLEFGEMLLLSWEAELPNRAQADDDEWLANIVVLWRTFGLINYGLLHELGPEGLRDKEAWLARYMDINAAVHRINAAIQDQSAGGASPDEEATVMLEPLPSA
jgi:excisionase family DNA binding protein